MGQYDRAIVCRKGHVINDRAGTSPQFNKKFCAKCGSPALEACENCAVPIQGDYLAEGVAVIGFAPVAPDFCHNCGAPYPWKAGPSIPAASAEVNRARLDKLERILGILSARATNGTFSDAEYRQTRDAILKDADLAPVVPSVVSTHRTLDDFWGFIKVKFSQYEPRRQYLRDQFEPVLAALESEVGPVTQETVIPPLVSSGDWMEDFVRDQQGKTPVIEEPTVSGSSPAPRSKKIFVVHGHDEGVKEAVARLLEHQGLEPIILHEQPNRGRTIIEKFEAYTDVGYAVAILTPDDLGKAKDDTNLEPRARQNVLFEMGFFFAALNRENVAALLGQGVEEPSDVKGIAYISIDRGGAWKQKLLKELDAVGYKIDFSK